MEENQAGRRFYLACGIMIFIFSVISGLASFSTGNFPSGHDLMTFAVSVMCFCLSYLYPQLKENDERSKRIKERGMFISYFYIMGYLILLMPLFQFNILHLDGYQTVSLIAALIVMTVFVSFVFYAKRY